MPYKSEFDFGFSHNIRQVFGSILWTFPFPFYLKSGLPNGDGIIWKTNEPEGRLSNESVERRPYSHSHHTNQLNHQPDDESDNDD